MTSEEHNKYVAYSFFAFTGFQFFWLLLVTAMFYFISAVPDRPGDRPPPIELFGVMFTFVALIQIIFTAPAAIAGWAVLRKKQWARTASIIGAVMSGMSVPIGTAACVYAMWFFLGDKWKEVYEGRSYSTPHTTLGLNQADEWSTADQEKFRRPEYEPKPGDWR